MWTLISIAVIRSTAAEMDLKVLALVQGGNQVIIVTKLEDETILATEAKRRGDRLAQEYGDTLRRNLLGFGMKLKREETIVSTELFVYSKKLYYQGRVLPQSLKAATRLTLLSETLIDDV